MLKAIKKIILFIAACVIFVIVAVFGAGGKKAADIAFGKFYEGKTSVQKGDGKNDIKLGTSVFMSMDYDAEAPQIPYMSSEAPHGKEYSSSTVGSEGLVASLFDDRTYELKSYTFTDTSELLSEGDTVLGETAQIDAPAVTLAPDEVTADGDYDKIAYYSSSDDGFAADAVTEDSDDGDMTVQCEFGFAGTEYFTRG